TFRDHFSSGSDAYRRFRPRYPEPLFAALAAAAPGRTLAWDCGTGNGQAAVALAKHFAHVMATDASRAQLAVAETHPRVQYRAATAEASGLDVSTVDLVTVAQALHWFDLDAFYAEVRRVVRRDGVLAAWSYGLMKIDPSVDAVVRDFYTVRLGAYWPAERRYVDEGYRTIPFPFPELALPPLTLEATLTLEQLAGYVSTWSAVHRYVKERGESPVPELVHALRPWWGGEARQVRWPLAVRAGRVSAAAPYVSQASS
ncbi:MAG TPA: class I SAM-dependent methyltransferase, partial [Gemmatimonadaceae bacterium]|nr:class I SAM-dependent methyltransferase [Gemmatimonadaceae bacterium]